MRLAKKTYAPARKHLHVVKTLPQDQDARSAGGFPYMAKPRPFFQDAALDERHAEQEAAAPVQAHP